MKTYFDKFLLQTIALLIFTIIAVPIYFFGGPKYPTIPAQFFTSCWQKPPQSTGLRFSAFNKMGLPGYFIGGKDQLSGPIQQSRVDKPESLIFFKTRARPPG